MGAMASFSLMLLGIIAALGVPAFFYFRNQRGLASPGPAGSDNKPAPGSAVSSAQSAGGTAFGSPPSASLPHRWYHWLLAVFTGGMTLIITLPTAFSQKKRTQQKVDSLWRKYQELRKLEAQRLAGFDYLLQSDHLETKQNGVFLQEARAGDTVTKTDGTVSLKGHTSTGGVGVAIGPVGVGGAESFSRMKGTMESTGRSKQGKDRAVDIDDGQLELSVTGLRFVGKLQVRDIPTESIIQVAVDQDVMIVASASSSLAQRFRFRERFEAEVFGRVASITVKTGSMPDLGAFEKEIAEEAAQYRSSQIVGLQEQMRNVARG